MVELNDSFAWMVVAGMTLPVTAGVIYLTRGIPWWWLRSLLRALTPLWCLAPAVVPGQPGHYAPAFTIAFFEAVLQAEGRPEAALRVLVIVTLGAVALVSLAAVLRALRRRGTRRGGARGGKRGGAQKKTASGGAQKQEKTAPSAAPASPSPP